MNATLRTSTLADLETHVAHRVAMFKDMEMGSEEGLKRMAEAFRTQLRNWLVTGQCRGLVLEESGKAVASVLLLMKESVPTPVTPLSVRGYLFNVFTVPSHRRKGLAARLTDAALDLARDLGLEIVELHASPGPAQVYADGQGQAPGAQETETQEDRGEGDIHRTPELGGAMHAGVAPVHHSEEPGEDQLAHPDAAAFHQALEGKAPGHDLLVEGHAQEHEGGQSHLAWAHSGSPFPVEAVQTPHQQGREEDQQDTAQGSHQQVPHPAAAEVEAQIPKGAFLQAHADEAGGGHDGGGDPDAQGPEARDMQGLGKGGHRGTKGDEQGDEAEDFPATADRALLVEKGRTEPFGHGFSWKTGLRRDGGLVEPYITLAVSAKVLEISRYSFSSLGFRAAARANQVAAFLRCPATKRARPKSRKRCQSSFSRVASTPR